MLLAAQCFGLLAQLLGLEPRRSGFFFGFGESLFEGCDACLCFERLKFGLAAVERGSDFRRNIDFGIALLEVAPVVQAILGCQDGKLAAGELVVSVPRPANDARLAGARCLPGGALLGDLFLMGGKCFGFHQVDFAHGAIFQGELTLWIEPAHAFT